MSLNTTCTTFGSEVKDIDLKTYLYRIYVVTWNVGSKLPDNISLRNLLGLNSAIENNHLPDIYALGFQEVNIQPSQHVKGLFKEDPWTNKAKAMLKDFAYVAIKTEQMQGLLVTLFVRRQHVGHLKEIESEFTRTGFGGIWGNKGAVSIRLNMYGAGLTFIVSHLAAHDHHLDERIEDFKQIMDNHRYHVPQFREIFDHDYVFWFGDLNFRLMGDDTSQDIRDKIVREDTDDLIQRDQLSYVRECTQEAFPLLHERKPSFPPTFKFKEGTCEYDLKRRPAWTDRILYAVKTLNKATSYKQFEIEQCAYKSHPCYNISDHKPVTSEFIIKLFPHYYVPGVEFKEVKKWLIGEENVVEYKKSKEFEERNHDWIGIYNVGYASLKDYLAYEYVNQAESSPSSPPQPDPFWDNIPALQGSSHHYTRDRINRLLADNEEIVRLAFTDDVELKGNEEYILIYFQNTGLRGITSVAGISNIFKAEKRSSSPNFGNID